MLQRPRAARLTVFVLLGLIGSVVVLGGCQRVQRPFAGEERVIKDTPTYTVQPRPNGGVQPIE